MADKIIELMARAGYARYMDGLIGCCEEPWDKLPEDHRERLMDAERAAATAFMDATREPSEEMVRAIDAAIHDNWPSNARKMATAVNETMHDKLREEALGDD